MIPNDHDGVTLEMKTILQKPVGYALRDYDDPLGSWDYNDYGGKSSWDASMRT